MSLQADLILRKLQQLPVTQALKKGAVPLPPVKAPSLEGLVMTVEAPEPPTADELSGRFVELLREHGVRRERARGEKLAAGDEVEVDVLGYVGGKLMPGGVRFGWSFDLVPNAALEGLAEQLTGAQVGGSARVKVKLGAEHPNPALRGKTAELIVDVLRAFEVKPLNGDDPAALVKLGRGKTLDEVMLKIADELISEWVDGAWADAEAKVLEEVANRAGADVGDALVDEELRRRWGAAEGTHLSAKGFDAAEQQEALDLWLEDPVKREEVRSRLRLSLALKAIAERDGVKPEPEQLEAIMVASGAALGLDEAALKSLGKADPAAATSMVEAAYQQQLIGYVLEQAEVREVDAAR